MQQCFGGGFLDDILGVPQPHTFTSASSWREPAWGQVAIPLIGADTVRDFTDAWRANIVSYGNARAAYVTTLGNNPGVKDPFAPPGVTTGIISTTTYLEHPQYASPDAPPGPGPNDLRRLFTPGPGGNNYAILVSWDAPRAGDAKDLLREQVEVSRIYNTLRTNYNVPFNNIVTLFNGDARGSSIAAINGIKGDAFPNGENLGAVFIDNPNTRANWLNALAGNLFVNANNALGIQYGPNDRLFIYNTGHGGEAKLNPMPGAGQPWLVPYAQGFSLLPQLDDVGFSVNAGDTDLLQISTRSLITDSSLDLVVNGVDLGPLAADLVTSQKVYDVTPFVGPTFTYQINVARSLLATTPNVFYVNLVDAASPGFVDPHLIAAIDITGGDQELVTIYTVPEPSSLFLLLLGVAGILRRHGRKSQSPGRLHNPILLNARGIWEA
jgi:hypothetical protein